MKIFNAKFWLAALLMCGCLWSCDNNVPVVKQHTSNEVQPPIETANIKAGHQIFTRQCTSCHGSDGTAGIMHAANLQTLSMDSNAILQSVTDGKKSMPAFKESLSKDEIQQVTAYVLSLHK